jgi:hypothetical protein
MSETFSAKLASTASGATNATDATRTTASTTAGGGAQKIAVSTRKRPPVLYAKSGISLERLLKQVTDVSAYQANEESVLGDDIVLPHWTSFIDVETTRWITRELTALRFISV